MKNNLKSIGISLWMVRIFAVLLAGITVGVYPLLRWYLQTFDWDKSNEKLIMLTIGMYCALPFAWLALYSLHKLLTNIRSKKIFDSNNVKMLGMASLSCFAASAIGLIIILIYLPKFAMSFGIVTVAAFFAGLLVRVVQNVFKAAIDIKEENDLTV